MKLFGASTGPSEPLTFSGKASIHIKCGHTSQHARHGSEALKQQLQFCICQTARSRGRKCAKSYETRIMVVFILAYDIIDERVYYKMLLFIIQRESGCEWAAPEGASLVNVHSGSGTVLHHCQGLNLNWLGQVLPEFIDHEIRPSIIIQAKPF